jgi:hypothetical protein
VTSLLVNATYRQAHPGGANVVKKTLGIGALLLAASALSACSSLPGEEGGGNPLLNIVRYGGTTVPPEMNIPLDIAPCPQVDVITGGAAIRSYAGAQGDNQALRSQVSIGNLARNCLSTPDGFFEIDVGVEVRALLGPRGAPGRFDAPLRIVLRNNTTTFDSRQVRASVVVPAGQTQGNVVIVEEKLRVPASVGSNYLIEVGLGQAGRRG